MLRLSIFARIFVQAKIVMFILVIKLFFSSFCLDFQGNDCYLECSLSGAQLRKYLIIIPSANCCETSSNPIDVEQYYMDKPIGGIYNFLGIFLLFYNSTWNEFLRQF